MVVFAALGGAASALATPTYTVSGFADGVGSCSGAVCTTLRAAVTAADSNPGATITLGAGAYQLSIGELPIDVSAASGDALTITGAGPTQTVIKQVDGQHRVLDYTGGGPYLLQGLEVTGGTLTGVSGDGGGGIDSSAALTLDDVAIVGNSATGVTGTAASTSLPGGNAFGGGLSETGTLKIVDSTISGNTATGGSGASATLPPTAYAPSSGGYAFGGGVYADGTATITGSTISGNTATGGAGGNNFYIGNGAGGGNSDGGGLQIGGTATFLSSTIVANAASGGAGGIGFLDEVAAAGGGQGGGVGALDADHLYFYSDTVNANTADALGGNLLTGASMDTMVFNNTVIAGGVASGDATGQSRNCELEPAGGFAVTDDGHNLENDAAPGTGATACGLTAAHSDVFGVSAKLGTLAGNGGSTQTELPLTASPLLRAGGTCLDPSVTPAVALTTDQRGDARGSACDLGAVQTQPAMAVGNPSLSGTAAVGQTLTCSATDVFTGDELTYSYGWLRNGTAIAGQTGASYALASADGGTTVACDVTATGVAGAAVTASVSVAVPAPPAQASTAGGSGAIRLVATKLTAGAGKVKPKLRCVGGTAGCSGKLKVTIKVKRKTVVLASGSYRLASGKSKTLALKLSARALRLLTSDHGRLRASLALTPTHKQAVTRTVTITKPKPKKRKR